MASIFSNIIAGQIPSYKVAEDENYLAFLDIFPLKKGHTLVIPKQEVDYIFDLDAAALSGLTLFAQRVAKAIDKTIPCQRVGVAVIGLEVPHAHVHLVPLDGVHDIDFSKPKLEYTQDQFKEIAESIASNFE
ncbi:MAG: HIT family protein [Bacteroidia bacterium]